MNKIVVITGLPAAGKSFLRERLERSSGRKTVDCSAETAAALEQHVVWMQQRETLRRILALRATDFWPLPGLLSLDVKWFPHEAAAFESQMARLIAPAVLAAVEAEMIIEATPVIAWTIASSFPIGGKVLLVTTSETTREHRLAERVRATITDAAEVAAFHRAMYQPALFSFENEVPGWRTRIVWN